MTPVLLVSGDFVKTGGMDRANLALATYLANRGYEVHLVAHRADPELVRWPGVALHRVPKPLGSYLLGGPVLDRVGQRWAARLRHRNGRAIVNGGNCGAGDINWVHYVHAAWSPRQGGKVSHRARRWLNHRAALHDEQRSLRKARLVIANSERTRTAVIEQLHVPAERVHTIYYGTDAEVFRPPTPLERVEARVRLGWADKRPAVAFIGALGDLRKGFDTLLSAWQRLARDPFWDARLVVVGAGSALDEWRQSAAALQSSVEFLGFRRDVPEILRACDAVVSPTRYEAYGLNVHEAICCGLPALVSQSAGVAERYPAELDDLLIPDPDDPVDLAARLRRWRERISRPSPALATFSEELRARTWNHMAEQIERTALAVPSSRCAALSGTDH